MRDDLGEEYTGARTIVCALSGAGSRRPEMLRFSSRRSSAYHVELLQPIWPDTMKVLEKELHDLTDCLGDDHDFAELRRMLAATPGLEEPGSGVAAVIELIDRRRSELQSKAGPIGARTYSEKPRAFSRRIESYWEAWRSRPEE